MSETLVECLGVVFRALPNGQHPGMKQSEHRGKRFGDLPDGGQIAVVAIGSPSLAGTVARGLDDREVSPLLAFGPDSIRRATRLRDVSLILLETSLPGDDPGSLVQELVTRSGATILTYGDAGGHRIVGTSDDHVDPGSSAEELVDRSLALMSMRRPVRLPSNLSWDGFELDTARRLARWRGRRIHLTTIQFRIMEVLVLAGGSVVSTQDLARRVWGRQSFDDKDRLLAHVRRIRRTFEPDPSRPRFLVTVRGEGFRLMDSSEIGPGLIDLRKGSTADGSTAQDTQLVSSP